MAAANSLPNSRPLASNETCRCSCSRRAHRNSTGRSNVLIARTTRSSIKWSRRAGRSRNSILSSVVGNTSTTRCALTRPSGISPRFNFWSVGNLNKRKPSVTNHVDEYNSLPKEGGLYYVSTGGRVLAHEGRGMNKPRVTKRSSDEAVKAKTGKVWAEWFKILDKAGASKWPHAEIASYLRDKHKITGWWCQMVAVGYEHERGIRKKFQNCAGDFSANSSRTFRIPVAKIYRAWTDEKLRRRW